MTAPFRGVIGSEIKERMAHASIATNAGIGYVKAIKAIETILVFAVRAFDNGPLPVGTFRTTPTLPTDIARLESIPRLELVAIAAPLLVVCHNHVAVHAV